MIELICLLLGVVFIVALWRIGSALIRMAPKSEPRPDAPWTPSQKLLLAAFLVGGLLVWSGVLAR